jgi:hypothetical protein
MILCPMTKPPHFLIALISVAVAVAGVASAHAEDAPGPVETIVLIRHGEKPATDLGQLNCQGLNRALALPDVLATKYGKPDFIFAPLPRLKPEHSGESYSYVRPLMTIEPTAIRLGMPVDARFAFTETVRLQHELLLPRYRSAMVFIAWEHHLAEKFAKDLLTALKADASAVPVWPANDFDSIYVLKLSTANGKRTVSFNQDHEGLDGLSPDYPLPKAK